MDAFMLEGWTPILLLGATFTVGIYFISRKVSIEFLYKISLVLSFICFVLVIYSMFVVRGWEGIGLTFVAISVLSGTWIGTIIGASISYRSR